jgi:hypothetical protein
MSTVTMQELELETAELLPSRETLNACCRSPHSNSYSVTNGSSNGNGDGNGNWGLIVVSGNGDGNFNGSTILGGL